MKKVLLSTAIFLMVCCSALGQKEYSVANMIFKIDSVINSADIQLCKINYITGNGGFSYENLEFYFDDFFLVTTENKNRKNVKTYYNMDKLRRFYIEDGVVVFVF